MPSMLRSIVPMNLQEPVILPRLCELVYNRADRNSAIGSAVELGSTDGNTLNAQKARSFE